MEEASMRPASECGEDFDRQDGCLPATGRPSEGPCDGDCPRALLADDAPTEQEGGAAAAEEGPCAPLRLGPTAHDYTTASDHTVAHDHTAVFQLPLMTAAITDISETDSDASSASSASSSPRRGGELRPSAAMAAAARNDAHHHICDPIEGHDDAFDVELSFLPPAEDGAHREAAPATIAISLVEEEEAAAENGDGTAGNTTFGKVVRTIQKSFRRIFHRHPQQADTTDATTHQEELTDAKPVRKQGAPVRTEEAADREGGAHSGVPLSVISLSDSPIASVPREGGANLPLPIPKMAALTKAATAAASIDRQVASPLAVLHKSLRVDMSYSSTLLGEQSVRNRGRKCLLLDLDETLVHSTFQHATSPDLVVPVHLGEDVYQPIYVCKRPGVDAFLRHVLDIFEVVIFTASLSNYADPVIDFLDPQGLIAGRLYRESCFQFQGMYIKDLSRLGRDLDTVLLVDNSPISFSMQPEKALACRSWFDDDKDAELNERILPLLVKLAEAPSISKWRAQNLKAIETPY